MGKFLDDSEVATLTGRKRKTCQIAALRKMGLPFVVNATGHPVITWSGVEGGKSSPVATAKIGWQSNAVKAA